MLDVILIQENRAHEIWRGTTIEKLTPLYSAELVAQMVEQPAAADVHQHDIWNVESETFSRPPAV